MTSGLVDSLRGGWVPASKGSKGRTAPCSQASLSGWGRAVGTRDGDAGHPQTHPSLSPLAGPPCPTAPNVLSMPRCISTLYQDPAWSQVALQGPIECAQSRVCSSKMGAMSPERLQYYVQELASLEGSGHSVSLIDLWGLLIEYVLYQAVREEHITNIPGSFPARPTSTPFCLRG